MQVKQKHIKKNTSITKEIIQSIIIDFANGTRLKECREKYGVKPYEFENKLDEYELTTEYARAREIYCSKLSDKIDELIAKLEDGSLKSDVGRVIIETLKWELAKYYPKRYGDKIDHTSDGKRIESNQLTVNYAVLSDEVLKQIADATTTNKPQ